MEQKANAAAAGGIDENTSVEELRAKLAEANAKLAEAQKRHAAQLEDRHAKPGTANESHASSKERWAIMIEEGRDANEVNPVFVGVNGRGYNIRRGVIVEVPKDVLSVLDTAVELRPIPKTNPDGTSAGFDTREARRFPYRNYGKIVDKDGQRINIPLPEAGQL